MRQLKILFAGDFHMNLGHALEVIRHAKSEGYDRIVQVGDFGYWPHVNIGKSFLAHVNLEAEINKVPVYFIDGNHDNHDALTGGVWPWDYSHLHYMSRGTIRVWDGVPFVFMGGAHSIDKNWRVEGETWWAGENITKANVDRAIDNFDVMQKAGLFDLNEELEGEMPRPVMVTHEVPESVLCEAQAFSHHWQSRGPEDVSNRRLLQGLYEYVNPGILIHGHWHTPYTHVTPEGCKVVGLGSDGEGIMDSVVSFDTAEYRQKVRS